MNEFEENLVDRLQAEGDMLPAERKEAIQRLGAARIKAHQAFDPIWQEGKMTRGEAYSWLAKQMGMSRRRCHMELMNEAQCLRVIEICGPLAFENLDDPLP